VNLVFFACPGMPSADVQRAYADSVGDFELVWLARAGFSSVFTQWAAGMRRAGRVLPELLAQYAQARMPHTVTLVCYSAGYGFARELLLNPADRVELDALVLLDSLHATVDAQLDPFVAFARAARDSNQVFWTGYTDVPTHGYWSTRECNEKLVARVGVNGGFNVHHWEQPGLTHKQRHANVLTKLGPPFVAEALAELRERRTPTTPITRRATPTALRRDELIPPAPALPSELELWQNPTYTIGERCLAWLGGQYGLDPREIPGPVHNDVILSYSMHARRGGIFRGVDAGGAPMWEGGFPLRAPSDEWAWCAYLQSETLRNALLTGEVPPHGLRAAVHELVTDARKAETLRGLDYVPRPGDLGIEARVGEDPLHGGRGHVWCVVRNDGRRSLGLGGNENNKIECNWRDRRAPAMRAWIARCDGARELGRTEMLPA